MDCCNDKTPFFTIFTPTYNRGKTLHRVFDSLKNQTFKSFEWIIIDDGSNDNTKAIVRSFISENPFFNIVYLYQTNQGKHVATNNAVNIAKGTFFITIDSDDAVVPEALYTLAEEWEKIRDKDKEKYKGISCRTCDAEGVINGTEMLQEYIDCSELDLRFKYKINGELWGMTRTEIMKEFPYPEIKDSHFFPENVRWNNIGRKYITRYLNIALRIYFNDQTDALTAKTSHIPSELIYVRKHYINEAWDYFKYDPIFFIKQCVGVSRDGFNNRLTVKEILTIPDTPIKKLLVTFFLPVGLYLQKRNHKR